jgi:predicted GH43/DUF377 family glycosyl hydrolase
MPVFKSIVLQILCIVALNFFLKDTISAGQVRPQKDSFIEKIFKIEIPGLKGAYNPSMVDFNGGYLMVFRYDTYKEPIWADINKFHQYIGVIFLDDKFKPKGPWQRCIGNRTYDPRLLKVDDTIYMIFASAAPSDESSVVSSRLNICKIKHSKNKIYASDRIALMSPFGQIWEKNWPLFNYDNQLLLEYTISPHVVVQPSLLDGSCEVLVFNEDNSNNTINWPYGIIRGGTPALPVDGKYLGFFHSSQIDPHTKKYTYYMGAYTFLDSPPFTIDRVSPRPFYHPDFFSTPPNPKTSSRVIFPGGFVVKKNKIFLCYGENDDAIKVMVINKKRLYASMRDRVNADH